MQKMLYLLHIITSSLQNHFHLIIIIYESRVLWVGTSKTISFCFPLLFILLFKPLTISSAMFYLFLRLRFEKVIFMVIFTKTTQVIMVATWFGDNPATIRTCSTRTEQKRKRAETARNRQQFCGNKISW